MLKDNRFRAIIVAIFALVLVTLACAPSAEGDQGPTIVILSPADGATVTVGQEVYIVSIASAEAGVKQVDLSVNTQFVRTDAPQAHAPQFQVAQPWTPQSAGQVVVSVLAYDENNAPSPAATITLQVAEGSGAAAPPAPSPTPDEDVESASGCTLNASYVADLTIPDDAPIPAGTAFAKMWQIRNSGTCDWGPGFHLVFVGGDQMGGEAAVAVLATAAGSTVDLSVHLEAPSTPGTYRGDWRVQSDGGVPFGSTFYVQIVVPGAPTATPEPTETPKPPDPTLPPLDPGNLPDPGPLPQPINLPSFQLYGDNYHQCEGETYIVFMVVNDGERAFESSTVTIESLTTPAFTSQSPRDSAFMVSGAHCPGGSSERLKPGQTKYLPGRVAVFASGEDVRATVTLCTEDGGGGICVERQIEFAVQ